MPENSLTAEQRIDAAIRQKLASDPQMTSEQIACWAIQATFLEDPEASSAHRDYVYLHVAADRARRLRLHSGDPRQAYLDLPGFQIPVEAREDGLEEYRARQGRLAQKITEAQYPRLSGERLRIEKRELRDMKRLDPKIAPYFANDREMTVSRATALYLKSLETPIAARNRRQAKTAVSARWARTKNQ